MIGISLCAGLGSRINMNMPKAMIEVDGLTIIESQINTMFKIGITTIIIVTGYKHKEIYDTICNIQSNHTQDSCNIIICQNNNYQEGILSSILAANNVISLNNKEPILRLDGDIFFHLDNNLADLTTINTSDLTLGVDIVTSEHPNLPIYDLIRQQIVLKTGQPGDMEWSCIELYQPEAWRQLIHYIKIEHPLGNMHYPKLNKLLLTSNVSTITLQGITEIDILEDLERATSYNLMNKDKQQC